MDDPNQQEERQDDEQDPQLHEKNRESDEGIGPDEPEKLTNAGEM
jgi:hypothetical protein